MLDCVYELELHEGPVVRFEDDLPGGGSSLLFAYHEHQIYSARARMEIDLDSYQIRQIQEWFEEYEA